MYRQASEKYPALSRCSISSKNSVRRRECLGKKMNEMEKQAIAEGKLPHLLEKIIDTSITW